SESSLRAAPTVSSVNDIAAVGTLEAIYVGQERLNFGPALDGPEILWRTLSTITQAWREAETWRLGKTGAMLRGLARWISDHPDVSVDELARVLRTREPSTIHDAARA